ncbi:MAG: hypothetical protein IKN41_04965 [Candidatus Methanomethylophilaceae archaeon]|nr:hypothetical protein [Candidatus Methanomethylophilaceae archaeon]
MSRIVIFDDENKEMMTVTFDKTATLYEAIDSVTNLKKKEISNPTTGYREMNE